MKAPDIASLCDHPEWVAEVARAHVAAFGALLPDWTVEQAEAELRQQAGRDALPLTWLATRAGQWLGSVSLLQNDHDDIRQYSPWLASLYVKPEARAGGVGRALVWHCVREAGRLRIARLHLYCTDAVAPFYASLGWQPHDRLLLGPMWVNVMAIVPPQHGPDDAGAGFDAARRFG